MNAAPYPDKAVTTRWQVVPPPGDKLGVPAIPEQSISILKEISEFRGRTLYADGRRPRFIRGDGEYADDDPVDLFSYHVTVRSDGDLIGYARVTPFIEPSRSFLGRLLGPLQLQAALRSMNLEFSDCAEAGRWIVAPGARGSSLARNLLLSLWVLGRWLGKRCLFGAVGVREGQVMMLGRCGGQAAPAIAPLFVQEYDDELTLMYFNLQNPPPGVAAQLKRVERHLKLRGASVGPDADLHAFSECRSNP